jgi:hypothetical protein
MQNVKSETKKKFVLFQGVQIFNWGTRFYSSNVGTADEQIRGDTGAIWYKIIGYADSAEEAQIKLWGRTYSKP